MTETRADYDFEERDEWPSGAKMTNQERLLLAAVEELAEQALKAEQELAVLRAAEAQAPTWPTAFAKAGWLGIPVKVQFWPEDRAGLLLAFVARGEYAPVAVVMLPDGKLVAPQVTEVTVQVDKLTQKEARDD